MPAANPKPWPKTGQTVRRKGASPRGPSTLNAVLDDMGSQPPRRRKAAKSALCAVTLATAAHLATYGLWRRWCLDWGATDSEASAALQGDDLLAHPDIVATRAITINAAAGKVWPWLAQRDQGEPAHTPHTTGS